MAIYKLLLTMLTTLILPLSLSAAADKAPVSLSVKDDSRAWVLVREDVLEGQGLAEYMLEWENRNNWTEVVTLQYFSAEDLQPRKLYDVFIHEIEQQGGGKVQSKILDESNNNLLAEWSISGSDNDQSEIIRIMSNGGVVAIVRYTAKAERVDAKNSDIWRSIIRKAEFVQ